MINTKNGDKNQVVCSCFPLGLYSIVTRNADQLFHTLSASPTNVLFLNRVAIFSQSGRAGSRSDGPGRYSLLIGAVY